MTAWFMMLTLAGVSMPVVVPRATLELCEAAMLERSEAAVSAGHRVVDVRCVRARVPALQEIGMEGLR